MLCAALLIAVVSMRVQEPHALKKIASAADAAEPEDGLVDAADAAEPEDPCAAVVKDSEMRDKSHWFSKGECKCSSKSSQTHANGGRIPIRWSPYCSGQYILPDKNRYFVMEHVKERCTAQNDRCVQIKQLCDLTSVQEAGTTLDQEQTKQLDQLIALLKKEGQQWIEAGQFVANWMTSNWCKSSTGRELDCPVLAEGSKLAFCKQFPSDYDADAADTNI